MLGKKKTERSGIKDRKMNPFYILAVIYTSKKWSHRSFYTYIQETMLLLVWFSLSSNIHKEKTNSYIRDRERETKNNHRWNNDTYCNIENRRYTNIYIEKDMKLFFNAMHKKKEEKLEQ